MDGQKVQLDIEKYGGGIIMLISVTEKCKLRERFAN